MIEVANLVKRYGSTTAVNGISFRIERGEVVGFLGPNGAGKSTTLRILTCYQPATSGHASIDGFDCLRQSMQVRQRIGYLPEGNALYGEMRVHEFLTFRGRLRGLTYGSIRERIGVVVDRCWLGDFIDRPISQLSKGMRQRVGLAEVLLHNPPVLILDEPTVGLDPTQIRETRQLLADLAREHTILLSSHILSEVAATCGRIIIIDRGRIAASGTVAELTQTLSRGRPVIAELRAEAGAVRSRLGTLGSVSGVEVEDLSAAGHAGWVRVTLTAAEDGDPREALAGVAAGEQWPLRELRRPAATLEEYFVRITARQAAAGGEAALQVAAD